MRRGRRPKPPDQLTGTGARIRRLRLARGLTISQAAASAGVNASTWRGWEVDRKLDAAAEKVAGITRALGCSVEEWCFAPLGVSHHRTRNHP